MNRRDGVHCSPPLHALAVVEDVLARNRLELLLFGHAGVRVPVALGVAHRVEHEVAGYKSNIGIGRPIEILIIN